ncbi:putative cysteine protease atg4 [Wickerhamiella sorbophila]|uniref:Cysteine protease n=1 Tax=Wickerhamiella sorbophila TaxID=45607 RepID=A0A2T0FI77_9ASCO|nr:putative cysteine protease atg4 [Wickerhamiella sorbophila]PRT54698.1 putative cysteine protease atg4 [Wickerhamiella sorbophila]
MATSSSSLQRIVQMLWTNEPTPTIGSVVCLGTSYPCNGDEWPVDFIHDVESRVWLRYRNGFAVIPKHPDGPSPLKIGALLRGTSIDLNGFVSDIGWGCMIRTGQSLLANALMISRLSREWRYNGSVEAIEQDVLVLFYDEKDAPLSIHRFVEHGSIAGGKLPGEWFGPSTVATCIKALVSESGLDLAVYISDGMNVYEKALLKVATGSSDETDEWQSVLVLCGLRLGIDTVNPVYFDGLRSLLDSPQTVGIAGGRTATSHYFYGYQNDRLFFHDPHDPSPALKYGVDRSLLESVHSRRLRELPFTETDPSMLAGFILKSREDFESWKTQMMSLPASNRAINITDEPAPVVSCEIEEDFVLCHIHPASDTSLSESNADALCSIDDGSTS